MTNPDYTEIVRLLAEERERQAQTKGAIAELERRLLDEFGLRTDADARAELKRLEKELAKSKAAEDRELAAVIEAVRDRPEFADLIRRLDRADQARRPERG